MKILVENYTFNAATKEIALTDYTSVNLESFLLITNVTDNVIIYNFADPAKGGTVTGNVLTLDFDTTGMSNTDSLQVFIDDGVVAAKDISIQDLIIGSESSEALLRKMINMMQSLAIIDTSNRQRIAIDVINGALPANQSVNMTQVAGFAATDEIINNTRRTFVNGTRANLTIT